MKTIVLIIMWIFRVYLFFASASDDDLQLVILRLDKDIRSYFNKAYYLLIYYEKKYFFFETMPNGVFFIKQKRV